MFVLQKEFDFSIIKEMWFNFGEGLQNSLKIEGINKEINLYFIISTISSIFERWTLRLFSAITRSTTLYVSLHLAHPGPRTRTSQTFVQDLDAGAQHEVSEDSVDSSAHPQDWEGFESASIIISVLLKQPFFLGAKSVVQKPFLESLSFMFFIYLQVINGFNRLNFLNCL